MNTEIFDLGKIGITLGGEYDNKVIYEKLTIVLYKGKSYISTKTTQGISPEQDILVWQLVAEAKDAYHMLIDAGKITLSETEFLEQLVDATKGRYILQGNITNAADEEDLTVEHSDLLGIDTLKLANRDNINGMGYIILRKNKSFAEQITKSNTIYEIRYNFDLNEEKIEIPTNCVLKFIGGTLSNGIIQGNNTLIKTEANQIFNINLSLSGSWSNRTLFPEFYGAKGDGKSNDTEFIQKCISVLNNIGGGVIRLSAKTYRITQLDLTKSTNIDIIGEVKSNAPYKLQTTLKALSSVDFMIKIVDDYDDTKEVPVKFGKSITVDSIYLDGNNVASCGINMNSGIYLRNSFIRHFNEDGIVLENCTYPVSIEHVESSYNGRHGLYIKPLFTTCYNISNSEFNSNIGYGMVICGGEVSKFDNNIIQSNLLGGVKVQAVEGTSTYKSFLSHLCFINCYVEANGKIDEGDESYEGNYGVIVKGLTGGRLFNGKIEGISFINCSINASKTGNQAYFYGTHGTAFINTVITNKIDYDNNIEFELTNLTTNNIFIGPTTSTKKNINRIGYYEFNTDDIFNIQYNVYYIDLNIKKSRIKCNGDEVGLFYVSEYTKINNIGEKLILNLLKYIRIYYPSNLYYYVGEFIIWNENTKIEGKLYGQSGQATFMDSNRIELKDTDIPNNGNILIRFYDGALIKHNFE